MEKKLIYDLHSEHREWANKMIFYKDELKIMQKRIEEIASKNSAKDILALVEHFQNQIIIQSNNIDELKHRINEHEQFIQAEINKNEVAADKQKSSDHPKMREDVSVFEKTFNDLRKELVNFLARWM